MIDSIIEGIGVALRREFGEGYEICTEESEQGLKKSCFFIQCTRMSCVLFRGQKYFRENRFLIRYFPGSEGNKNQECYGIAERLSGCLEFIAAEGIMRGTNMEALLAEGILDYYVNYDCFIRKEEETEAMEEWKADVKVREGSLNNERKGEETCH